MSPSYLFIVFIALCAFTHDVCGDVYMQNPRGNNDRLNEAGDRNNANRLFDSENNARGGYCWGPELTYFEGSVMNIEWTNQHACGNDNTACNIVMQYMCTSDDAGADPALIIRDGTTTNTIPTGTTPGQANYYNQKDAATGTKFVFGMNEPIAYYQACAARSRNLGLFTADQNVATNQGAMATRQNPNGNRSGFECSEERDYYPYWAPTPWVDVVVMTGDTADCALYKAESGNVKGKNQCNGTTTAQKAANNEADCIKANGVWALIPPNGKAAPDCKAAPANRDNHLGNGVDGVTNSYNWTLPRAADEDCIENGNCTCVLRIRYNITLGELVGTEDSLDSGIRSPVKGDPTVSVDGQNFTLAVDTAQTGRTFQDRSYMFRIAPRPAGVTPNAKIYNLNVRGKRGNIVQTYPATEYDFTPQALTVDQDDYVHFQWTGCDTNPAGNTGEGKTQTDRSNIVQIADMSKNYPINDTQLASANLLFKDADTRKRLANIDQVNCLSAAALKAAQAATGTAVDQNSQNCMVLNQAGPRFSGALVQMDTLGTYAYMSTRNNNFSNRSQKASITVKGGWAAWKTGVIVAAGVVAIAIGASAGTIVYAKRNPHSRAADIVSKIPGINKI